MLPQSRAFLLATWRWQPTANANRSRPPGATDPQRIRNGSATSPDWATCPAARGWSAR